MPQVEGVKFSDIWDVGIGILAFGMLALGFWHWDIDIWDISS